LKLVCFDVCSSFGFFRKGFTTTFALSHALIPRSTVEGLTASILGLPRPEFPDILVHSKIAVEIMSPVRKMNMKYMHINPKWWYQTPGRYIKSTSYILDQTREQMAVPASVEILVNPAYRIYFDTTNETIDNELAQSLSNKQSHYTPYMGASSMISSLRYVGEFEYKKSSSNDYMPVSSVIPFSNSSKIPRIELEKNTKFAIEEDLSIHVDNQRRPQGTYKVVYTIEPRKIMVIDQGIAEIQINEEEKVFVKFLPTYSLRDVLI
jgi:CRISPR-associated protein Cas5h